MGTLWYLHIVARPLFWHMTGVELQTFISQNSSNKKVPAKYLSFTYDQDMYAYILYAHMYAYILHVFLNTCLFPSLELIRIIHPWITQLQTVYFIKGPPYSPQIPSVEGHLWIGSLDHLSSWWCQLIFIFLDFETSNSLFGTSLIVIRS